MTRHAPATRQGRQPAPGPDPMFYRSFHSDHATTRVVLAQLRTSLLPHASEDALARLELALAEVLNNIGEHGRAAPADRLPKVHLCVICQGDGLVCAVTDDGAPLPRSCLTQGGGTPRGIISRDNLPEGGFGWPLIRSLTRSISHFRQDKRNFLTFVVPRMQGGQQRECA